MIWVYIAKVLLILLVIILVCCIGNLYKVFSGVNQVVGVKNAKGWIAWGLMAEVILIVLSIIKLITL